MTISLAVSALACKRAELAGEIGAAEKRLRSLRDGLAHVDATLRLFDPAYPIAAIKAKHPRLAGSAFNRGELIRAVLDVLRPAAQPMTIAQIAAAIMERQAMPASCGSREYVESRVDKALRRQEGQTVEKVVFGPRSVAWRIMG